MKKLFILILGCALFVITGCASGTSSASSSITHDPSSNESSNEQTDDSTEGKTIVVYFSGSGNTQRIAEMIAQDTGADTFVIEPSEPYTQDDLDWTDSDSRVNREHDDASLQNVSFSSTDIPQWDTYSTVFIGYPIWWQDASWVVKSFVQQEDFTGKTVIPFCTSISSPLGDSGKNLADLASGGDWQEGIRFGHSATNEDVTSWLASIGY